MQSYNAIANVEYKTKSGFSGSFGLPTLFDIKAERKRKAQAIAIDMYEKHPDLVEAKKKYGARNIVLHLSIEEAY